MTETNVAGTTIVAGTPTVVPVIDPTKTPEPVVAQPQTPNLPKTQEEMDAIVRDRVARAKESAKEAALKDPNVVAAFAAQKALNELARAGMTEPEKIATDLKAAQELAANALKENAELKAYQLKQAALSKANLPLAFADRLHGNTEDEITADIGALVEQLKALATPQVKMNGAMNPAAGAGSGGSVTIDQRIKEAQDKGDVLTAIRLKMLKAEQK